MAEKNGKGVSFSGKDDSSSKSKRGRKVQFNSQDEAINFTLNSDAKSAPSVKGNVAKGSKGDKDASSKKTDGKDEVRSFKYYVDQELPNNATCLMDCEAEHILQCIQEQLVILSDDPLLRIPGKFDKGLQLARSGIKYKDAQSVRRALHPLTKHGVHDSEICLIAKTCPETVDQVFGLLPSLKGKRSLLREPIKDAINELAKLKVT